MTRTRLWSPVRFVGTRWRELDGDWKSVVIAGSIVAFCTLPGVAIPW